MPGKVNLGFKKNYYLIVGTALMVMYSDCQCKKTYMLFLMHKHCFNVMAKALKGFDAEEWSLEQGPLDFRTHSRKNFEFSRTGLRTTLMCCLL